MALPVALVDDFGLPVSNGTVGIPMTVAEDGFGLAVVVVESGGLPVVLLNEDGTPWEPEEEEEE